MLLPFWTNIFGLHKEKVSGQQFPLRSNTTRSIENHLSSLYTPNLSFPFSCQNMHDQHNLLRCPSLLVKLSSEPRILIHAVNYKDKYDCLVRQKSPVTVVSWLLKVREELLGEVSPAGGGSLDASHMGDSRGLVTSFTKYVIQFPFVSSKGQSLRPNWYLWSGHLYSFVIDKSNY